MVLLTPSSNYHLIVYSNSLSLEVILKLGKLMRTYILPILASLSLTACATIVNDPTVPVALSFSDGSSGTCQLSNSRASYTVQIPTTENVRRARSGLNYNCKTNRGKTAVGNIPSSVEGEKIAASVIFFDLGITDAITEKGRTYPASFVIPVQ